MKPLKIIHLEDLPADADMVARTLAKSGISHEMLLTDNETDFVKALKEFAPDVIISDHSLPSFDSHEALKIIKEMDLEIPFILVTATVSEEYAVNIIKEGASDYILKDRLHRLPSAIMSALEKLQTEKELVKQRLMEKKLISSTSIQAQERERDEIGKELHDNINQVLAAAKLYLQTAIRKGESKSQLLEKSHEYIKIAIDEIRKLSHTLIAPSLGEIALTDAITELITDFRLTASLEIRLITNNFNEALIEDNVGLMFYRIIQEQVNNIVKHAEATKAVIEFTVVDNHIVLQITDNGKGFNTANVGNGIGLKNINNRVNFFDGTTHVISAEGKGCSLEVSIPIKTKAEE